ncbi:MAG: AIR synthase related protein, partial [Bradymonadaceae bacterium]
GIGTVVVPGQGDAAVIRVPGTEQALAISADCNSRFCYLDPREGARLAVAECARNLSCVGALPLGVTDCLNFGDPTHPEIMWQFSEAVEGMSEACEAFGTPVVSGNVSLYNASFDRDIYPTPTVAMVGSFETPISGSGLNADGYCDMLFKEAGDLVYLLGETHTEDLGGSEYLWMRTGELGDRPPRLDLDKEKAVQILIRRLIGENVVRSAHDCSEGGLGVALAESCIGPDRLLGLELDVPVPERPDLLLFTESPSRIVVSVTEEQGARLMALAAEARVPIERLGQVTERPRFVWGDVLDKPMGDLHYAHSRGLATL